MAMSASLPRLEEPLLRMSRVCATAPGINTGVNGFHAVDDARTPGCAGRGEMRRGAERTSSEGERKR